MTRTLADLTHELLDYARQSGADAADALAVDGTSMTIDVRAGALENAERSEGVDIGVRVFVGNRQACVSTSDTRSDALKTVAERAVQMARLAPEDPYCGLADPAQLATEIDSAALELFDPSEEPAPAELQDMAQRAEAAGLSVAGVEQVISASAGYSNRALHLAATNGFSGGYRRSDIGMSCVALAGKGGKMERDADGDGRIFRIDLRSAEDIGRTAGERAVAALNPRRVKTGAYPVIIDERVSSTLIGHLLSATNGAMIARGSSWARQLMDQQVLPDGISLIENPHRARISGSKMFDAEGLPTRKRAIVENGVLQNWTLDLANARKLGLESTGSAARGTSAPPSPSVTNLELTQGTKSREDLMKEIGTGFLINSFIGATINPNTGDYSRGASGFWIENGEIAYPVNEVTVAGNLIDMLKKITPANDARTYLSRVIPSLLVEGLTLAGE
ncbi:TldD/PmbA family protein [Marivivens donghaensis]|uniref:TldD/PmbA family protein n=1 Tax=Marivivens donghaensis TaxID=1699413 RepID=A0ABX0VY53_9RHOB|nr:TldD/PmbA family protein [Marivivens donghaensis]NIY71577.1 TldD/PmbA family protein [Marivivens donghaensis]